MSGHSLVNLIADHLRATGWREGDPGCWWPPGMRVPKPGPKKPGSRRITPAYSHLLAAAQSQITTEYYAELRAERERSGHPDVPEPLEAV